MCNLYNISTNQEAMRALGKVANDILGNLEPLIDAYPDRPAPVVRNMPGGRELAALTWGMPSPSFVTKGNPDTGVTNIRHIESKHWQPWRSVEHRCLVPWTKFCEWEDTKPRKTKRWFAINEEKPLAFFAGIWTTWNGVRGSPKTPRPGTHELFGFLTCEPNEVVAPIHPKAMLAACRDYHELVRLISHRTRGVLTKLSSNCHQTYGLSDLASAPPNADMRRLLVLDPSRPPLRFR